MIVGRVDLRNVRVRDVLPIVRALAENADIAFERRAAVAPGIHDVVSLRGWLEDPVVWVRFDDADPRGATDRVLATMRALRPFFTGDDAILRLERAEPPNGDEDD